MLVCPSFLFILSFVSRNHDVHVVSSVVAWGLLRGGTGSSPAGSVPRDLTGDPTDEGPRTGPPYCCLVQVARGHRQQARCCATSPVTPPVRDPAPARYNVVGDMWLGAQRASSLAGPALRDLVGEGSRTSPPPY